jgi:hypothetical protein
MKPIDVTRGKFKISKLTMKQIMEINVKSITFIKMYRISLSLCTHRRHSSIKISNQIGRDGIMFSEAMLRRMKSVLKTLIQMVINNKLGHVKKIKYRYKFVVANHSTTTKI